MWPPAALPIVILLYGTARAAPYIIDARNNVAYSGYKHNRADSFPNIPFGQDTGGANRFTSPKAFVPVAGIKFSNTTPGHVCPQPAYGGFAYSSNATDISEDCLNLKVVRPSFETKGSKLLILAYIYRGLKF